MCVLCLFLTFLHLIFLVSGYERLAKLLLRIERRLPSLTVMVSLFVMMFDGEHAILTENVIMQLVSEAEVQTRLQQSSDHSANHLAFGSTVTNAADLGFAGPVSIQNPDVMGLIFSLLRYCDSPLRLAVVRLFVCLVKEHTLNQSYACASGLLDAALDLFPRFASEILLQRNLIALIEHAGTHALSVKQLKRFFSLMKSVNSLDHVDSDEVAGDSSTASSAATASSRVVVLSRPWYNPLLLQALQNMKSNDRQSSFFYFDGACESCMLLLLNL